MNASLIFMLIAFFCATITYPDIVFRMLILWIVAIVVRLARR